MNTSIFYIKGFFSAYYNLEQAIKEAKCCAKCEIIKSINWMKESEYDKRVTDQNIEDCILKYRVTIGAGRSIKVKAIASIPYKNSGFPEKMKNVTFTKTYTIYSLSIEGKEEGVTFELPFTKK